MTRLRELLERRAAIATEMRGINDKPTGDGGDLGSDQRARWEVLKNELSGIDQRIDRQSILDDADCRAAGTPLGGGSGDDRFDREVARVGLLDAIRAQIGGTDEAAGRAREISAELERRSGRRAQGLFWSMRSPQTEQRVLSTSSTGSNIIGTDYRPDLFIDALRKGTVVRSLGARTLTGLVGNVAIPKRTGTVAAGWVAEGSALPNSDPSFGQITLSPKHAGVISELSRNMIQQASPDVEALARDDMAKVLGETLDAAAIAGTGTSNQPTGILNTSGVSVVAIGRNGGPITMSALALAMGSLAVNNADGGAMAWLTHNKVRQSILTAVDSMNRPISEADFFHGAPYRYNNLIPDTLTKGTGTGLKAAIYGNWNDLLIGIWSELDILVNPYESTAYSKGNVQIRAMLTVDIAVRHPESFAVIKDIS